MSKLLESGTWFSRARKRIYMTQAVNVKLFRCRGTARALALTARVEPTGSKVSESEQEQTSAASGRVSNKS